MGCSVACGFRHGTDVASPSLALLGWPLSLEQESSHFEHSVTALTVYFIKRGLIVSEITAKARLTPQTFNNCFSDKEKFFEALMSELIPDSRRNDGLLAKIARIAGDRQTCDDFRQTLAEHVETVVKSDAFRLKMIVALFGRDQRGAISSVRRDYNIWTNKISEQYQTALNRWGVTLNEPFDTRKIAVLFTALMEGLALRALLDEEPVKDLAGDAFLGFAAGVINVGHERHKRVDDLLAPLFDAMDSSSVEIRAVDSPKNLPKAIIGAARDYLKTLREGNRLYVAELSGVARKAKVPYSDVKRRYSTLDEVAIAALRPQTASLKDAVDTALDLGRAPEEVIWFYLDELAGMAFDHESSPFIDYLMMKSVSSDEILKKTEWPQIVQRAIEHADGHGRGIVAEGFTPFDTAARLTRTLLVECSAHRGRPNEDKKKSPEDVARFVCESILRE